MKEEELRGRMLRLLWQLADYDAWMSRQGSGFEFSDEVTSEILALIQELQDRALIKDVR